MTHYISFPGLGIGEMQIDRVAFTIFGREVMWYGIILTLGIICAFAYISWRATKLGLVFDDMLDFVLITVPVAIIGARLYYILTESGNTYNSFYDVIAFWNGGIAIYGAIIAGGISVFLIARHKKIRVLRFFDCATPGVMLGQIIGRWGNFMNAEAFGIDTTLPWRMGISSYAGGYTIYVHPTFLYESLWNLLGFAIINLCFKKRKFDGQVFLMYVGWYGIGRAFIELLRTDSLWILNHTFRASTVLGLATFAAAAVLLVVYLNKPKSPAMDQQFYMKGSKYFKEPVADGACAIAVSENVSAEESTETTQDKAENIPESEIEPDNTESSANADIPSKNTDENSDKKQ